MKMGAKTPCCKLNRLLFNKEGNTVSGITLSQTDRARPLLHS